ncbi:MAG: hypothetical protein GQ474_07940 [Sulfurimonas sp.]|nr:hypothetical protein [Sulfurimonas sp.]
MNKYNINEKAANICGHNDTYKTVCKLNSFEDNVCYLQHRFGYAHPFEIIFTIDEPSDLMQTVDALMNKYDASFYCREGIYFICTEFSWDVKGETLKKAVEAAIEKIN